MVKHLHHIEDVVLLHGTRHAYAIANNNDVNISLKWDGSPSVVLGCDELGELFVSTKSFFNKQPIKYCSNDFVTIPDASLAHKLQRLFEAASQSPILQPGQIIQGDLLFWEGESSCFRPNVIRYVPFDPPCLRAQAVGVAWHTVVSGDVPNVDGVPLIGSHDMMWSVPVNTAIPKSLLPDPPEPCDHIDHELNKLPRELIVQYTNHCIKSNQPIDFQHLSLLQFIASKAVAAMNSVKTAAAKSRKELEYHNYITAIHNVDLYAVSKHMNLWTCWKHEMLEVLNNALQKEFLTCITFVDGTSEQTQHEGFVVTSVNGSFKLVDRLMFSKNNFSSHVVRGWTKYNNSTQP